MPFRIRSKNPIVRIISAVATALAWWAVMATTIIVVIPFFGTFDTQAFLTGTEPKNDFLISGFEMILAFAIIVGVNYLYGFSFKRLTRYVNRKLKRNIEWEDNPMG